jgi:hypothetical protein
MPTATASANVTVAVAMQTAEPNHPGTQTEHSVEVDSYTTHTTSLTTDAVVASTASGSNTAFSELSELATDQSGNTIATTYGGNGLQFALTPESNLNNWSNSPPTSVNQTLTDGSTYNRTYSAAGDGSYTETDNISGLSSGVITVKSNGSGVYNAPGSLYMTMSAPSSGQININWGTGSTSVPSWLPSQLVLYSDVTGDTGVRPLAASCGNLSSVGSPSSAERIVRTISIVDPVLGYTDTRTIQTWDLASFGTSGKTAGPICVVINDTENVYYDYSLESTYGIIFSKNAQPVQVNAINETFSLAATPTTNIVRRTASTLSSTQIAAHVQGIAFARSLERAQRLSTFVHAMHARHQGGAR